MAYKDSVSIFQGQQRIWTGTRIMVYYICLQMCTLHWLPHWMASHNCCKITFLLEQEISRGLWCLSLLCYVYIQNFCDETGSLCLSFAHTCLLCDIGRLNWSTYLYFSFESMVRPLLSRRRDSCYYQFINQMKKKIE